MSVAMPVLLVSAVTLILAALLVGWLLKFAATMQPESPDRPVPSTKEMKAHLLWGLFYVNADDPRGWVPKTSGFGYTVNFRTERNAKVFAALILATAASAAMQIGLAVCGG